MQECCLITYPGQESGPEVHKLGSLPDLLKAHPEGLCRGPFFFAPDQPATIQANAANGSLPLSGPFLAVHAIRRARDLLLVYCDYEGVTIQLEVQGRRLPELPGAAELEALLQQETTLVIVNDRPYKATTEVFGFQHVYDDTVRFIDGLKNMGIPQETMSILATPEEIAIEVHPGVFGVEDDPALGKLFHNLTCHLGAVKAADRRLLKTVDRTLVLSAMHVQAQILLPGSIHPMLHRPKVGVGPSHFAYGPAAFSDYCGKKRTLDECVQELKTWLKFVKTPIPQITKAQESLRSVPSLEVVHAAAAGGGAGAPLATAAGGFQSLQAELAEQGDAIAGVSNHLPSPMNELNKCLGGGWRRRGVHLLAGPRESGKAAFLATHAMHVADQGGVLFISYEHSLAEFASRLTARTFRQPLVDILGKRALPGVAGEPARQKFGKMLTEVASSLKETLFFRVCDSALDVLNLEQIGEMAKMIPAGTGRFLMLESLPWNLLLQHPAWLEELRTLAGKLDLTILLSMHTPEVTRQRPHLIEGPDLEILEAVQREVETVLLFDSDRVNLKKFVAMTRGKVEPELVAKLEQGFVKAAGGTRLKSDTYLMMRSIHSRTGLRQAVLYSYQRDVQRFYEGPAAPLNRP